MEFKDSLKFRRERAGYTQTELAKKVGVVQQMIAGIETGVGRANHILVIELAKVLDCSTDELLGLKEIE